MHKIFLLSVFTAYFFFDGSIEHEKNCLQSDSVQTVTLAFIGDLMCHSTQFDYARVDKDSFDFNPHFEFIDDYLSSADYTFGNLETVFGGKALGYVGYPNFNSPDDYASAIKNAGLDFLFTSNNHSLDKGEQGVLRTLKVLDELQIKHAGTYPAFAQRDSIQSLNINGFKISILSYTYGTNGKSIPAGKEYLINTISLDRLREDISRAKLNTNSIVLIYFHFGEEYQRVPNDYQKQIVDSALTFGADIIIGSHPHVLQRSEKRSLSNSFLDTGFVAFSLGNFFSNQQWRYSNVGGVLYLRLEKNITKQNVRIASSEFLPAYVFRGVIDGNKTYRILPLFENEDLKSKYKFLAEADLKMIDQAFADTKKIIEIPLLKNQIDH